MEKSCKTCTDRIVGINCDEECRSNFYNWTEDKTLEVEMELDRYEYEAVELFMDNITRDELIIFIIGQNKAIEGLTANNRSFREAYKAILERGE